MLAKQEEILEENVFFLILLYPYLLPPYDNVKYFQDLTSKAFGV